MSDIASFFAAMGGWWIALMSGVIGLFITLLERVKRRPLLDRSFVAIGVFAMLAACFMAWKSEHEVRTKAEKDLELLSVPKLDGRILGVEIGTVNNIPSMLVLVRIRNLGAPSVARDWQASLPACHVQLSHMAILKPIDMELGEHTVTYPVADALYDKLAEQPLQRGAEATGMLWFRVDGFRQCSLGQAVNNLVVQFQDVSGRNHFARTSGHLTYGGEMQHFPGMHETISK